MPSPFESNPASADRHDDSSNSRHGWLSAENLAEVGSSLSASVSGALTFSLVAASRGFAPLAIPAAMLTGGLTKLGVKSGAEQLFVEESLRTAGIKDFAWGAVDGLAGVTATWADGVASRAFLSSKGTAALGENILPELAQQGGKEVLWNSAFTGVKNGLRRGAIGGSVGSFTWSVPHRLYENADELKTNPLAGGLEVAKDVAWDTGLGGLFGSALVGGGTALFRGGEILGSARSAIHEDPNALRLRALHVNDLHSHIDQLPAMKTVSDQLVSDAQRNGMHADIFANGDMEGASVKYRPEKAGKPENTALINMGVTKIIPANHTYNFGGGFNVPGWVKTMTGLTNEHPQASVIATNLDLSAFPEYQKLAKPFVVDTIASANGPQKVATLGLITKQGTELGDVAGIGFKDPVNSAVQTMLDLASSQKINKFIIMSHLGLDEDKVLAQALVNHPQLKASNLKVAAIMGGHTHDVTAAPLWVGRNGLSTGGLSTLRNRWGGYEIPIVQAGKYGDYLGQLDLTIRPNGAADPYKTFGKMHAINQSMPKDADLATYVNSQMTETAALRATNYNARITGELTLNGMRSRENFLGNLVSDAIDQDVRPDAVLTHSCWINNCLPANVDAATGNTIGQVTRESIANLFKSAGNPEVETQELSLFKLRGSDIKDILEHSVRKHVEPTVPSVGQKVGNAFSDNALNPVIEEPGEFLQVAGLKFQYDLSKAPMTTGGTGDRISNILMRDAQSGQYRPIDLSKEYSIASRNFSFERWKQGGLFADRDVETQAIPRSPVEMLGNFIANRTIDPSGFVPEGRIIDLTPRPAELPLKVHPSIVVPSIVSEWDRNHQS